MRLLLPAALLTCFAPAVALALEPRFDHRDQRGLLAELLVRRDSVAVGGEATHATVEPALRMAWGFDLSGEGSELFLGATTRLGSYEDPGRRNLLLGVDARYRGYFGSEEFKTFFEVGLAATVISQFSIGPLVGIGLAYDFSRRGGIFAGAGFSTGYGSARTASFTGSLGLQLRWE